MVTVSLDYCLQNKSKAADGEMGGGHVLITVFNNVILLCDLQITNRDIQTRDKIR